MKLKLVTALKLLSRSNILTQGQNKTGIKILLGFFGFLYFVSLISAPQSQQAKIRIMTSIFPLKEFTKAIVGDRGEVSLLLPPGAEIHSWRPRPSDIVNISRSDVFIYVGPSLEPWIEEILNAVKNPKLKSLEASKGMTLIDEEGEHVHHEEEHAHGAKDPHFWLDFEIDQRLIDRIEKFFSDIDTENSGYYRKNAALYNEKLERLDQKYSDALLSCVQRNFIIGGHAAFGYLARRYNLYQISLYGINPDSEPTPKQLTEVVELAKMHNVRVIFFEQFVSDKLAKVLAKEVGAQVSLLNPGSNLSSEQIRSGTTFIDIMEKNLESLKNGLNCR
jgi:zinc transport system substrate-binding protein